MTVEECQIFLHLHKKHMAAYVLQEGIQSAERAKYIYLMDVLMADVERELQKLLS